MATSITAVTLATEYDQNGAPPADAFTIPQPNSIGWQWYARELHALERKVQDLEARLTAIGG